MHKNFDINSVKVFDLIRPEARVWTELEKALIAEGVPIDSRIIEQLIEFARAVVQLQNWKQIKSKRELENNLDFRIHTIRRLAKQLKQDEPIVDDFLGSDFLKRQIFFALFEKATLVHEQASKRDARDTTAVDLELYKLVKALKREKVAKPVEVLTAALQRSGVLKGVAKSSWGVRTVQNKISKVAKNERINKRSKGMSPMKMAEIFLQKELRSLSGLISELSQSLPKMKDSELYVLVPKTSKFVFSELFSES